MSGKHSWEQRVRRARELAQRTKHSSAMLSFYAEVLAWQRDVFGCIACVTDDHRLTGFFEHDEAVVLEHFASLIDLVRRCGSDALAAEAGELDSAVDRWDELLFSYWNGDLPPGQSFFARACMQPYLEALACAGKQPFDSNLARGLTGGSGASQPRSTRRCPFCGRRPQLALFTDGAHASDVLGGSAAGSRRYLMCGDCLTTWPFPRLACVSCEEATPRRLPYYSTTGVPNIRVDCCDSCLRYIKSIDLTRDLRPVPLVDELAAIPLDLLAKERGYTKVLPNLAGI